VHQAVAEYVRWRRNPAKMPSRYVVLSRRMKKFMKEFELSEGKGRKPTVDQMASALGQSRYDVMKVQNMGQYPVLLNTAFKASSKSEGGRERTYEDIVPSVFKAPLAHTDSREVR
jgi:DNA-directed RNA polymerase sigma subunit (sigma70/sigma32)